MNYGLSSYESHYTVWATTLHTTHVEVRSSLLAEGFRVTSSPIEA